MKSIKSCLSEIERLREEWEAADAVVIGAGAGLSASAGFAYSGERFRQYFADFEEKYGFHDMYTGGFYPYRTPEEHWAYWSRHIYVNRYMDAPKPVYQELFDLVKDKDYFVLTTNVDHCFQKAGFDKKRLFYTQGYVIREDGTLTLPEGTAPKMVILLELVPYCSKCRKPMSMNLRADQTFVEDEGWRRASERYADAGEVIKALRNQT